MHKMLPLSLCPGAKTAETPAGKTRLMHMHVFFVLHFMVTCPYRLNTDSSPECIVAILCCVLDHMANKAAPFPGPNDTQALSHPQTDSAIPCWLEG